MKVPTIVLAGGSGFIGQYLARYFSEKGYAIIILSRNARPNDKYARYVPWDGKNPGPWTASLEGATALINLAGKSVNCRYTPANKEAILASRTDSTTVLGRAIQSCKNPPRVWLNSSTATIYRHAEKEDRTEQEEIIPTSFSEHVAKAWEDSFYAFDLAQTRQVAMRIAIVLGDGSALKPLVNLCKWGLGGKQGNGRQYVSWLHIHDLARMMDYFIKSEKVAGNYNCSSPNPIRNRIFMKKMRGALGIPFGLPASRWMLELGAIFLQTETELILKSRKVIPQRLMDEGFDLDFPEIEDAFKNLLGKESG